MRRPALVIALIALGGVAVAAPPAQRTVIDRTEPAANQEVVFGRADFPVGGEAPRHIHHGVEMAYVAEGVIELRIDGEAPRLLRAGDTFTVPREKPHSAKVMVMAPARVVSTWVVDKGRPLAEPAP